MRELSFEVALWEATPTFNPTEKLEACYAERHLGSQKPVADRGVIECLTFLHHCTMQMPIAVTMPSHMKFQSLLESLQVQPSRK